MPLRSWLAQCQCVIYVGSGQDNARWWLWCARMTMLAQCCDVELMVYIRGNCARLQECLAVSLHSQQCCICLYKNTVVSRHGIIPRQHWVYELLVYAAYIQQITRSIILSHCGVEYKYLTNRIGAQCIINHGSRECSVRVELVIEKTLDSMRKSWLIDVATRRPIAWGYFHANRIFLSATQKLWRILPYLVFLIV